MTEGEERIGEFRCNCNDLQVLPDGSLLVLLVCGDQESYISRIVRISGDLGTVSPLFTVDTWLLSIHFDQRRNGLFASTAGGRILEISGDEYHVAAEDVPFVSGFRSLPDGRLLAFGWNGLVMEHISGWRRLRTGESRRLFDLRAFGGIVFVCGDAGLFGQLNGDLIENFDLQVNVRLRRLCDDGKQMFVFSEAPVLFRYADGEAFREDIKVAPAWDAVTDSPNLLVGFGYHGLYRYSDTELEQISARRAFRMKRLGSGIAILADSYLWVRDGNSVRERRFNTIFRDMLRQYGL